MTVKRFAAIRAILLILAWCLLTSLVAIFIVGCSSDSDEATAYYNLGVVCNEKGEYDQAIAHCTEAIRLKPDYAEAYVYRGAAHVANGEQDDQAIADCTEAIRLKPDYPEAHYIRGLAYGAKGNQDQAIADFTAAIRLQPDDAKAYYMRGVTYETKGELDRAAADYAKAKELGYDE